jgi:hypothetical protein
MDMPDARHAAPHSGLSPGYLFSGEATKQHRAESEAGNAGAQTRVSGARVGVLTGPGHYPAVGGSAAVVRVSAAVAAAALVLAALAPNTSSKRL